MRLLILAIILVIHKPAFALTFVPEALWEKANIEVCFVDNIQANFKEGRFDKELVSHTNVDFYHITEEEKRDVKSILESEYSRKKTGVFFYGWQTCSQNPNADIYVVATKHVEAGNGKDSTASVSPIGRTNKRMVGKDYVAVKWTDEKQKLFVVLDLDPNYHATFPIPYTSSIAARIIHEFGHAVGIRHEHARLEAQEDPNCQVRRGFLLESAMLSANEVDVFGAYDPISVMNTCYLYKITRNDLESPKLSEQDKAGLRHLYSKKPIVGISPARAPNAIDGDLNGELCKARMKKYDVEVLPGPHIRVNDRDTQGLFLCINGHFCMTAMDAVPRSSDPAKFNEILSKNRFFEEGGKILSDVDAGAMNCHAYGCALAGLPGLTPRMALITNTLNSTEIEYSDLLFENVLNNFFEAKLHFSFIFEPNSVQLKNIQDGDLLVFKSGGKVIHTGVASVHKDEAENLSLTVISKAGEFPVIETSMDLVARMYNASEVVLYRIKGAKPLPHSRDSLGDLKPYIFKDTQELNKNYSFDESIGNSTLIERLRKPFDEMGEARFRAMRLQDADVLHIINYGLEISKTRYSQNTGSGLPSIMVGPPFFLDQVLAYNFIPHTVVYERNFIPVVVVLKEDMFQMPNDMMSMIDVPADQILAIYALENSPNGSYVRIWPK